MSAYPRWLYSKDHGSIVVDTPEDAMNLPDTDWYSTPDFQGVPVIFSKAEESRLSALEDDLGDGPIGSASVNTVVTPALIASEVIRGVSEGWIEAPTPAIKTAVDNYVATKIDKRTKAYRDSQK